MEDRSVGVRAALVAPIRFRVVRGAASRHGDWWPSYRIWEGIVARKKVTTL